MIFQSFHFKDYVYSVYVACLLLRNRISISDIQKALPKIEKKSNLPLDPKKIKQALQRLFEKKFLIRHSDKTFSLVSQMTANIHNKEKFNIRFLNFYDSRFKISRWQLNHYKTHSEDASLKDFLFGELIAKTYFEVPTTYQTIKKDLLLSRYEINKINELKSKEYHLNHYNPKDTAFAKINQNFSCIGKKYYKDLHTTKLRITPHLKQKIVFIDQNVLDQWGDVMNHERKIEFVKKLAGIKSSGSLSVREIADRYPCFFNDRKRDWFLPRLSEKLIINGLKKNDRTRKKIVLQDRDMLWWKDRTDLEGYKHPYSFDAPLRSRFHLYK